MEDGYDPEYLAVEKALGHRPGLSGTAEERAVQYNGLTLALAAQWPAAESEGVDTREETINEHQKVRIYTPQNTGATKLPVCVFYYGGGWIGGSLDTEDPLCRMVARDTPCIIVAVQYRLAPKNPFPTPLDDCVRGFEWAYANADKINGDPAKYFTWGGSAGAHLALAVTNRLVGSGRRDQVQACIAINPITCHPDNVPEAYKSLYKSYEENAVGTPIVDGESMMCAFDAAKVKPDDPDVLLVLSPHLASFPPTWISTNGKDVLRDDGTVLAKMLEDKGVKVKKVRYEGLPHYFHVIPAISKSREVLRDVVKGIWWALDLKPMN